MVEQEITKENPETVLIQDYYTTNPNDINSSGWIRNSDKNFNEGSDFKNISLRITKSEIPLEGILSYDSSVDESEAFKGILGKNEDNTLKTVTFSTVQGSKGEDGKNLNITLNITNLNDSSLEIADSLNEGVGNIFLPSSLGVTTKTETLNNLNYNNPIISQPYKQFTETDYFDLSYKQLIFEPSDENNYRVIIRNGIYNNLGEGTYDNYHNSNLFEDIFPETITTIFDYYKYKNKQINSIVIIDGNISLKLKETSTDLNNPDDLKLQDFTYSLTNFVNSNNISPYLYNFNQIADNNNLKYRLIENDTLNIRYQNLKYEKNSIDYNHNFDIRIKLSENEAIFDDDTSYKKGTIFISYGKITQNITRPIIGLSNRTDSNFNQEPNETNFLNLIDKQWLDENGSGVPGLKISISDGSTEKIVNDNEWNSYYSNTYGGEEYYIRIIEVENDWPTLENSIVKIQSIYDKNSANTYNYSQTFKISNIPTNNKCWWTEVNIDDKNDNFSLNNSSIYKIFIRKQIFKNFTDTTNEKNKMSDGSKIRTFIKIIYQLNSDVVNLSPETLDYNNPSDIYLNYDINSTNTLENRINTGVNFGPYHANPITALKVKLDSSGNNLNESNDNFIWSNTLTYNITGLEENVEYIFSIKDHFSRLEPGTGNDFFEERRGYGFQLILKDSDNVEISTDGSTEGEEAVKFPSITYTSTSTNFKLEVNNNRKYPFYLINISKTQSDTKIPILKFTRGINFSVLQDLDLEKMSLLINDDEEDIQRIKLVENTGSGSLSNSFNKQSVTFQINFEESNTIDLLEGYTFNPLSLDEDPIKSFLGTINKYIKLTNLDSNLLVEHKFPTYKIKKKSGDELSDNNYLVNNNTETNKEQPFKSKIYFPFIIPKKYRHNLIFSSFSNKLTSDDVIIYKNNYYLDYGKETIKEIENTKIYYENIKFPNELEELKNCLVYYFKITPTTSVDINFISVTMNTQDNSNLSYVLQIKGIIPLKTTTSSSSFDDGSFSKNSDFSNLFDYEEDNLFEEEIFNEKFLDFLDENILDEEINNNLDNDFMYFIKNNVNRSQKIKEEEINWISRSVDNNKNAYQGTDDFSEFFFVGSENGISKTTIIPQTTVEGVIYIGCKKDNLEDFTEETVSFDIELNEKKNDNNLEFNHFILSP